MAEYSEFEQAILITRFQKDYAAVRHYSAFPNITYNDLKNTSEKSRILGELFLSAGLDEINFVPLKKTMAMVNRYLQTGLLPRVELEKVMRQLEEQIEPLRDVFKCYKEAKIAKANGDGAPMVLFIPYYAHRLLQTCDMIDQKFDGIGKSEILKFMSTQWAHDSYAPNHAPA